jgi:hypothetical protein
MAIHQVDRKEPTPLRENLILQVSARSFLDPVLHRSFKFGERKTPAR